MAEALYSGGGVHLPAIRSRRPTERDVAAASANANATVTATAARPQLPSRMNRADWILRHTRRDYAKLSAKQKPRSIGRKITMSHTDPLDACPPFTESFNAVLQQTNRKDKDTALRVMMRMRERGIAMDITTYNLLLEILATTGEDSAFRVYEDMKERAVKDDDTALPNQQTYTMLIRACERTGAYDKAFQLFHEMKVEFGIHPDVHTYNTLIGFCVAMRDERTASELFEEMELRGVEADVHTYNSMMNVFSEAPYEIIKRMFEGMQRKGVEPNLRTYNSVMRSCQRSGDYQTPFRFFEELQHRRIIPNVTTFNILLELLATRYEAEVDPHPRTRSMRAAAVATANAITERALQLFMNLRQLRYAPNVQTYNGVMAVLALAGDSRIFEILEKMERHAYLQEQAERKQPEESDVDSRNPTPMTPGMGNRAMTLLQTLSANPLLVQNSKKLAEDAAEEQLKNIDDGLIRPDLSTFTALICASEKLGLFEKAWELFERMAEESVKPDKRLTIKMMDVCILRKDCERASDILRDCKHWQIVADTDVWNALLNVLAESCNETVFSVFEEMCAEGHPPNLASYNILIKACLRLKDWKRAFECFTELCDHPVGLEPTAETYNLLLDACHLLPHTDMVRSLLKQIKAHKVDVTVSTYNRAIAVFAKAIDPAAVDLFESLRRDGPEPDLDSYNALMEFYCNKQDERIYSIFEDVKTQGLEIETSTYNRLLRYCSLRRDRAESLRIFEELQVSGHEADLDTYNCLLSVFAESGDDLIPKVFEEMKEKRIEPDQHTFSTLIKHKRGLDSLRDAAQHRLLFPTLNDER
eukprot:NODE_183_length_2841_cov_29.483166_g166_i0.p1 GENE.NODE_183_length_2841_cov_29.483166_g166_i0~~NODE_183_length_2841_cov_29.483166_g166_i0.p1  ORF type:complete len:816 (+),score=198.74 NODE_183_length_2841_cov_29.483166_g166_i0:188-2635(+)